jgi:hypothetical protein
MNNSSRNQRKSVGIMQYVNNKIFIVFTLGLLCISCSKSDDDKPGEPGFEFTISGAMSKKVTGDYAYISYGVDQSSGKTIYTTVIGLSSPIQEFLSLGISKEGEIKEGTYSLTVTFNPFFSAFANYTENSGVTVYTDVSGTITFSKVSDKQITGSFNVAVENAGSTLQIKGTFTAVTA